MQGIVLHGIVMAQLQVAVYYRTGLHLACRARGYWRWLKDIVDFGTKCASIMPHLNEGRLHNPT